MVAESFYQNVNGLHRNHILSTRNFFLDHTRHIMIYNIHVVLNTFVRDCTHIIIVIVNSKSGDIPMEDIVNIFNTLHDINAPRQGGWSR